PAEAKLQGFMSLWFGPIMLGIMGGVFGFIGLVTFLFQRRRQQNQAFLLARGRPYMAEFQRVEREHDTEEGNSRFYVIARYYDKASHQVQVFRSDPLDFDPSDFIKDGQLITVLIHQDKPGVYYMDLSFLPQKA
ncbi:MAG: hypothetical protein OIF35_03975, partial [Cellvibrionaceae bacterium]|nr:hypothetical protein [Cellvibrionaceae bacterium]